MSVTSAACHVPSHALSPTSQRSVFVMAMNCDFLSPSGDGPDLVLFPGRRCDQAPHLFVALLAVPGTILMALVAWFMTIGESEMDPMARELTAVPFPHANTKIFLAVTTLDVLSVVLRGWGKQTGLLVSWLGCYIVYVQLRWVPYLTDWVNQLECALYSVMTYMGFCLTALSYKGPPFESVSMTAIYGVCLHSNDHAIR